MSQLPPRIEPLDPSEYTDEMRELLALPGKGFIKEKTPEFLATLVRHPGLYRRYAPFAGKLLMTGKLPHRDRELAILRVAWLCQAEFEWGEHVNISRDFGLTREDTEAIIIGSAAPRWNAHERAILKAVEEMQFDAAMSDATWSTLQRTYDEKQMLELPMLIGAYRMIACLQSTLRIRRHEANLGLAAR